MKTITEFEDLKISTRGLSASKIIKKLAVKRAEATNALCEINRLSELPNITEEIKKYYEWEMEKLKNERMMYNEIVYSLGISKRDWRDCISLAHDHLDALAEQEKQK